MAESKNLTILKKLAQQPDDALIAITSGMVRWILQQLQPVAEAAPAPKTKTQQYDAMVRLCEKRGDIVQLEDGDFYLWPNSPGAWPAWSLHAIAEELDRRNAMNPANAGPAVTTTLPAKVCTCGSLLQQSQDRLECKVCGNSFPIDEPGTPDDQI